VKPLDVLRLQICENNFMVLKVAPPLVVSELFLLAIDTDKIHGVHPRLGAGPETL
jgi:hypothetical protein